MRKIEIKNFTLDYEGIYSISFDNQELLAFLKLSTILKMLKIEGLSLEDIDSTSHMFKPIEFKKVTLIATVFDEEDGSISYLTSEQAEQLQIENNIFLFDFELKE